MELLRDGIDPSEEVITSELNHGTTNTGAPGVDSNCFYYRQLICFIH